MKNVFNLILVALVTACSSSPKPDASAEPRSAEKSAVAANTPVAAPKPIELRFSNRECSALVVSPTQSFVADVAQADEIVKTFYAHGKSSASNPKLTSPDAHLSKFYAGHSLVGTQLVLNFKKGAEKFLNGTTCQQYQNKAPLEAMLLELPGVKSIGYTVNGKAVGAAGWDG